MVAMGVVMGQDPGFLCSASLLMLNILLLIL